MTFWVNICKSVHFLKPTGGNDKHFVLRNVLFYFVFKLVFVITAKLVYIK